MLMARIELGELGDKGREREWLARALRAPRDRAWIAYGYVSDRWLPISPVTGAVDAFEWKAPVDAIGRGDDTLIIEEPPEPVTASAQVLAPFARPCAEPARIERREVADVVDVIVQEVERESPGCHASAPPPKAATREAPRCTAEQRLKPAIFVPERPPDDPGVAQTETDEKLHLVGALARGANPLKLQIQRRKAQANLASLRQWP